MTKMFSSESRLSAGFVARTLAVAFLIVALAGVASAQTPTLSVNPTTLNFSAAQGSTTAQTQNVAVVSSGTSIQWQAFKGLGAPSWITGLTLNGFTGTNALGVTINPTGLASGNYSGQVSVWSPSSSNAFSPTIPIFLTVNLTVGTTGTIAVSTNSLTFSATSVS